MAFIELVIIVLGVMLGVNRELDIRLDEDVDDCGGVAVVDGEVVGDCERIDIDCDEVGVDRDEVGCDEVDELTIRWILKSVICHVKAGII